jgi:hypothetical protein
MVCRHFVARIHCTDMIETFILGCYIDRVLQNLFWTGVAAAKLRQAREAGSRRNASHGAPYTNRDIAADFQQSTD